MKLYLSGGGDEKDSARLDKEFVSSLSAGGTLLYVPVAMPEDRHTSCLKWFESVIGPLWQGEVRMLTDLTNQQHLDSVGGIYMGGGDTTRLLDAILSTGFDAYLQKAAAQNIPIYGGSAGAIVLGETIETAPEADGEQPPGLNMLGSYSVVCHYDSNDNYDEARQTAVDLDRFLVVLTEQSGALSDGASIKSIGTRPVALITRSGKMNLVKPGDRVFG